MKAWLIISCLFTLGMAGLCFLGQMFVGHFLPTATAMGVFGVIAAVSGISITTGSDKYRKLAVVSGFGGVLSVAADVANYYLYLAIPGNYYGWFMFGPYAAALAVIGITGLQNTPEKIVDDSGRA